MIKKRHGIGCGGQEWGSTLPDGHGINAWSLRVGEPKGSYPIIDSRLTMGWPADMHDGFSRVERGVIRHSGTASRSIRRVSSLE